MKAPARKLTLSRRSWLLGAAALGVATIALAPRRLLAADEFDTVDFEWADAKRQRPVPARLYMPRSAGESARVPLVVMSHGIGGSRTGYRWLGQFLATQGIASLHPQHVGSDRQLWFGNLFEMAGRLRSAAQEHEALARVQDVRFALDTLLGGDLGARFNAEHIAGAGHSYGANTTLLAAGAVVQREGRPLALRDERLRAAVVISAPPFYGEGDPRRILSGIRVPSLHVTATEDVIRIPGYFSGADDRIAVYEAIGGPRKWLAMFEGGSHSMFTDRAGTGGVALNPQVKEATRWLVLAFLRGVFAGDDAAQPLEWALGDWPQRYSSILARFEMGRPAA